MSAAEDNIQILVNRLVETVRLIEWMLQEERRENYFEALRRKASGASSTNVTAEFFAAIP